MARFLNNGLGWPISELERLQDEINRIFEADAAPSVRGIFDRNDWLRMDVAETDDEIWVACDVPGVAAADLDVSLERSMLTIKGRRPEERQDADTTRWYKRETQTGSVQRTIRLPDAADPESVNAEMKNGVLIVRIGKRESVKPKRISVKAD